MNGARDGGGRIPNLFIPGAPKCGTTSMARYLASHPDVFMSDPKEPNYFCEDIPQTRAVTDHRAYLRLFPQEDPPPVAGEASTWYLYSDVALRRIYEFNPAARVLAMIRNPVDLVYSLHSQLLFNQIETEENFEKAWGLQSERPGRDFLQYREVGKLGDQIERLFCIFPESQVKVTLFDDFAGETEAVYRDVLAFLGIPDDGRGRFPVHNRSKEVRSSAVAEFIRRTPQPLVRATEYVKEALSIEELGLLKKVRDFNVRQSERPPLDPDFRSKLISEFRPQIEKLERLLDRDLSSWMESSS